jgi:hypothetical protein
MRKAMSYGNTETGPDVNGNPAIAPPAGGPSPYIDRTTLAPGLIDLVSLFRFSDPFWRFLPSGDSVKVTHNAYCVQWCSTRSRSAFSSW